MGFTFDSTGGLVGTNAGNIDIDGVTAYGGASTATILYSSATGQVSGSNDGTNGGLVGWNMGTGSYSDSCKPRAQATLSDPGPAVLFPVITCLTHKTLALTSPAAEDWSDPTKTAMDQPAMRPSSTPMPRVPYRLREEQSGGYNGGLIGGSAVFWGGTLSVKNSYATGSVTGLSGDNLGGAIGGDYSRDYPANNYGTNTNVYYSNGVSDPSGATSVSVSTLKGSLLTGLSSTVWTAGASGNGNSGFPIITLNSLLVPITYSVGDATGTYGTLASLGSVTFNGSPSNLSGTISLYNSSNTLVTLSAGLAAGTYTEEVTALTGTAASGYTIAATGNTFGTLTIDKAALTITANNQTKVYGAALPTLTASYTGFVNGDTVGQPDHASRRSPRRRPPAAMSRAAPTASPPAARSIPTTRSAMSRGRSPSPRRR